MDKTVGSSSSNHGTELLPKAVTVLGLIDIQENALLTRTLNSVELNSRSPSRTEAGFPGVTETVGSGAKLGLLRTLSPPEQG